ncbi:hypothetical protein FACS1894170_09920 [Planctomycetales bacterium]|nr:hypothetical protein FACS1894170_09920 [Planctomycetales bacterium]
MMNVVIKHPINIFLLVLLFAFGCHRGPVRPADLPPLVPCTISVTFGSEVIANVGVVLTPEDKDVNKWSAGGRTDTSGKAVMITSSVFDGVVPGNYIVSFKKTGESVKMDEPPSLIPKKYTLGHSKETVTVTKEQSEYMFELEGLKKNK